MDVDTVKGLLRPIVHPIYRILNDKTYRSKELRPLRQFADQVLEILKEKCGTEFFTAYEAVRTSTANRNHQTEEQEKFLLIKDPAAAAKIKSKKRKREKGNNNNYARKKRRLV